MISIWPVAHFFWGYSISLSLILILIWLIKKDVKVRDTREFLKKRVILGIFGGLWAMIPDMDYFIDENIIHESSFGNVFFFHISLDKVLPETDLFFAAEMLLIFAIINLFALASTVESFRRLNEALFGKDKDEDEMIEEDGSKNRTEMDDGKSAGNKYNEKNELKE